MIWKVACTRQGLILGGGIWECHQGRGGSTDLPTEDKGSIGFTTLATSERSPPQNVGLSESYRLGVLLVSLSQKRCVLRIWPRKWRWRRLRQASIGLWSLNLITTPKHNDDDSMQNLGSCSDFFRWSESACRNLGYVYKNTYLSRLIFTGICLKRSRWRTCVFVALTRNKTIFMLSERRRRARRKIRILDFEHSQNCPI